MPVVPATQEAERQENCLNPGGGGCGEPRSRHCTPAWVTREKLRLKKKRKKKRKNLKRCETLISIYKMYIDLVWLDRTT